MATLKETSKGSKGASLLMVEQLYQSNVRTKPIAQTVYLNFSFPVCVLTGV